MAPVSSPQDLLARQTPAIREITERLRRLVRETAPAATERFYPGWRGFGYRDPEAGFFCGVYPFRDHASIVLQHGAVLDDPDDILVGEGETVRVRWVPVYRLRDLRVRPIRAMIVRSLIHGSTR